MLVTGFFDRHTDILNYILTIDKKGYINNINKFASHRC